MLLLMFLIPRVKDGALDSNDPHGVAGEFGVEKVDDRFQGSHGPLLGVK